MSSYGVSKTEALRLAATSDMWTLTNPVLANGAIGAEIDTNKAKIGDGVSTWSQLSYLGTASGTYTLPAATSSVLGGITVSNGLNITAGGALSAAVLSVVGRTGAITLSVGDVTGAAPLASPALTGIPTAPTAETGNNSTQIATTAFVANSAYTLPAAIVGGLGGVIGQSNITVDTWTDPTAQSDFQNLINTLVAAGLLFND